MANLEDPDVVPPPGFSGTMVNTAIDFGPDLDWRSPFQGIRPGRASSTGGTRTPTSSASATTAWWRSPVRGSTEAAPRSASGPRQVVAHVNRIYVNVSGLTFDDIELPARSIST